MLRAWRMPIICALVWALLGPLVGALLVYGIYSVVVRQETERADLAFALALVVVSLLCLCAAVRSLVARVVTEPDTLEVRNALRTVRVPWSDVDEIGVIDAVNGQAVVNGLWYGVGVRVRGRRRQVRLLASWYRREERAQEFAERLRSLSTTSGGVDTGW